MAKTPVKKTAVKQPVAKKPAAKVRPVKEALTKTALITLIAEKNGLTRVVAKLRHATLTSILLDQDRARLTAASGAGQDMAQSLGLVWTRANIERG